MTENIIRFCDFERRSKQPDAAQPRNPCEADVIVFPIVRFPKATEQSESAAIPALPWSQ